MVYKWGYKLIQRVLNENWYWYKFSDDVTLKGQDQGQSIKFKVKLKKFSAWSEKLSERFWRFKYANFALDLHLITQRRA